MEMGVLLDAKEEVQLLAGLLMSTHALNTIIQQASNEVKKLVFSMT